MRKIRNSIYGLALGDAIGYQTEFLDYATICQEHRNENINQLVTPLLISDDTQMSLYLMRGFNQAYRESVPFSDQMSPIVISIARSFLEWLHDPDNGRAPGQACIQSLRHLERHVESFDFTLKSMVPSNHNKVDRYLVGGETQKNSKGSGTVMRSPWIGILNAVGEIPSESLQEFCYLQSSITHQHPTALAASYLTAIITSELYQGNIHPGETVEFAQIFAAQQEDNLGWRDIKRSLAKTHFLPSDYASSSPTGFDISSVMGESGAGDTVLATALVLIDYFGDDPLGVLQRAMYSTGDSDTIGATAGGILGAYYEKDIWADIEHLVEEKYVAQLEYAYSLLNERH